MLDVRADSIIYQSQIKLASLVDTLITSKRNGKQKDALWNKILLIRRYLKSLEYRGFLQDITKANYVLEQLIILTGINDFPVAPTLLVSTLPSILVGVKGDIGIKGDTGLTGATGLATDFSLANTSVTANVDNFTIGSAKGARWDYVVVSATADQRIGSIVATWKADGSSIVFTDFGSPDIGVTTGIEFSVTFSGGSIHLSANITSNTWTITGTRYFTPSNGNGSGPISGVLTSGKVYIGNVSNQASEQTISGAITIGLTGITTLSNGIVLDSNINASASIALTKLAPLNFSQLAVTTGAGFLTTIAVTPTEAGYLSGVTSNIQTQLNSKVSSAAGAISPYVSTNFPAPSVVAISDGSSKLGVSSITTTELSYSSGLSSNIQTQLNNKQPLITNPLITVAPGGPVMLIKIIAIGDWNMDSTLNVDIVTGVVGSKIRGVTVTIRDDSATSFYDLSTSHDPSNPTVPLPQGTTEFYEVSASPLTVRLRRTTGGRFDGVQFDSTSFNRGWVTITYEA